MPQTKDSCQDSPVAWFVVLERARAEHDFKRAAEAQTKLRSLGVRVEFARPKATAKVAPQ